MKRRTSWRGKKVSRRVIFVNDENNLFEMLYKFLETKTMKRDCLLTRRMRIMSSVICSKGQLNVAMTFSISQRTIWSKKNRFRLTRGKWYFLRRQNFWSGKTGRKQKYALEWINLGSTKLKSIHKSNNKAISLSIRINQSIILH